MSSGEIHYSPEGPVNAVPSFAGTPKLGEPSEFQFTIFAIVYLDPLQEPLLLEVAWYTFQICVPSGLWKKLQDYQHHQAFWGA